MSCFKKKIWESSSLTKTSLQLTKCGCFSAGRHHPHPSSWLVFHRRGTRVLRCKYVAWHSYSAGPATVFRWRMGPQRQAEIKKKNKAAKFLPRESGLFVGVWKIFTRQKERCFRHSKFVKLSKSTGRFSQSISHVKPGRPGPLPPYHWQLSVLWILEMILQVADLVDLQNSQRQSWNWGLQPSWNGLGHVCTNPADIVDERKHRLMWSELFPASFATAFTTSSFTILTA